MQKKSEGRALYLVGCIGIQHVKWRRNQASFDRNGDSADCFPSPQSTFNCINSSRLEAGELNVSSEFYWLGCQPLADCLHQDIERLFWNVESREDLIWFT